MIELPEAIVIARQMDATLKDKRIISGDRGNSPHKFAFSSGTSEEYTAIFAGQIVGGTTSHGMSILTEIGADHTLVLGCGGERILFHQDESALPKKHHLLLQFEDNTYLTITVQGWGAAWLLRSEVADHPHLGKQEVSPLSDAFIWECFRGLFEALEAEDSRSVKYFIISEPGIWGVGNSCLQDVLFRARIHPKRRAVHIADRERRALYRAIRETLQQMVDLGSRDSEYDLYNQPGGYRRILDSRSVGKPCPECGTPIEKSQYLGGAAYFCSSCQSCEGE
jgi:formamidopyrimidine-DNA glycosylase